MKTTIRENFAFSSLYQMLNLIVPLITTPYISRHLGASSIGIYSYSYAVAQYFSIFILLGLNNYGSREIAKVRNDRKLLSKTFSEIYVLQFTLGIAVSCMYLCYVFLFATNKEAAFALVLYIISVCLDVNWFFVGLENFKVTVVRSLIAKSLGMVAIFLFVKTPDHAIRYCIIMSLQFLVSQIVLWPFLRKEVSFIRSKFKDVFKHLKPNMFLTVTTISVSLFKYIDKVMLGAWTTLDQVGFYESAEKIIAVPQALITALGTVMLPRITNNLARGKGDDFRIMKQSMSFSMLMATALGFGIMGVANEFVPLFYGAGYETCIKLYYLLLPSCFFYAFAIIVRSQYILPHQMDRVYVMAGVWGAIANIVLNSLFIPILGSVGAAFGTLAAEAIVCLYQVLSVRKCVDLRKLLLITEPFLISGTIMFLTLYMIHFDFSQFISLVLKILIGMAIYILSIILISPLLKYDLKENLNVLLKR